MDFFFFPNVLFGNLLKHIVFNKTKQIRKESMGIFEATLYLSFQTVVKYKNLFTNAQETATLILVGCSNSV